MDRRRGGFRRQLRRLSDWRVIGWPLFWLSSVWLLLDAFPAYLRADAQFPATATTVILSMTTTQVVTFAILLVAKYSYLRPRIARRHPSWTVGSFALATFLHVRLPLRRVPVSRSPLGGVSSRRPSCDCGRDVSHA